MASPPIDWALAPLRPYYKCCGLPPGHDMIEFDKDCKWDNFMSPNFTGRAALCARPKARVDRGHRSKPLAGGVPPPPGSSSSSRQSRSRRTCSSRMYSSRSSRASSSQQRLRQRGRNGLRSAGSESPQWSCMRWPLAELHATSLESNTGINAE